MSRSDIKNYFDEQTLNLLLKNGFVVESNFDELKALEYIY